MLWRCGNCGYVWDGDAPPDKCPNCGFPKDQYARIPDDEAQLITRSRRSNDLHARLIIMMGKVADTAREGIDDNLDPGCLAIFTAAREAASEIGRRSRTEIKIHIGKGKWG